ncbi:MAG TPA: cyclic peptide export ABC transporter [Kofleriaceae bacterium]
MSTANRRMNIFTLLFRRAPNRVFLSILLDAMGGVAYAMIIPLVLKSIDARNDGLASVDADVVTFLGLEVSNHWYALMFMAAAVLLLATKTTARILIERVSSTVTAELRIHMYERLVQAPVAEVEKTGPGRIMAVLTEDLPWIISAGRLFPTMLSNLATLTGMLGYLAYLNTAAFWFVVEALLVGTVTYQIPMFIGLRFVRRKRAALDRLHRSIRALLDGFKELKLDQRKRNAFMQRYLLDNEFKARDADMTGGGIVTLAGGYGELINFFVIGIISFVFVNYHAISSQELIAVIMTLLYITGPVSAILQAVPNYLTAGVSLQKVNQLFLDMPVETASQQMLDDRQPWSRLSLREVVYRYADSDERKGYVVGPIDLDIEKGQITFIIGGNGSGKSTLGKIVTLHYAAKSGTVLFGDDPITDETLNTYRQQIGFIYSDYYLFEHLLGRGGAEVAAEVERYLQELGLDQKVSFDGSAFSTLHLSDGQRRRLALLVSFVEDKQLYLFDEWAADQDPKFKDVFYYKILPELKQRGKAVVVVSHDDRYFHVADKLVYMENGRIVPRPAAEDKVGSHAAVAKVAL